MNKKELIERIEGLNKPYGGNKKYVSYDDVLILVKQLDEPQKVTIPQFVAKYIREARECSWDFQDLFKYIDDEDSEELQKWFYHECNQETLAIAWINGYEIEEEKRYIVKLKNIQRDSAYLKYDLVTEKWYFGMGQNFTSSRLYHTKEELKKGVFEWIFSCEGVEIEEVE